MSKTLKTY